MCRKTSMVGLVAVLVMVLLAARLPRERVDAQEKPARVLPKWEYRIVLPQDVQDPLANQAQFDRLGDEGWELCVVHSSTRPNYCIFKRPKH